MIKPFFLKFLLLCLPSILGAVDLAPWYPRMFEIQPALEWTNQHSSCVASSRGNFKNGIHANFTSVSAAAAAFSWAGELDLVMADTSSRNFGFDSVYISGRYKIADDVSAVDPVSAVATLSVCSASKQALRDLTSFHHGKLEFIGHISVGKEFSSREFWISRFWGALGVGCADVGSPWLHARLCTEKNVQDQHGLMAFLDFLLGFGGKGISHHHFHGYGPIAHRSIDLGVAYRYAFEWGLESSLCYSYRVWAENFPKNTNTFCLVLGYPFGL